LAQVVAAQEAVSTLSSPPRSGVWRARGMFGTPLVRPGRWVKGGWVWTHFPILKARKLERCLQNARTDSAPRIPPNVFFIMRLSNKPGETMI
jgi:hypothetical protein